MTRSAWDAAIEDYYAEHDQVGTDADARGPDLLSSRRAAPDRPLAGPPDPRTTPPATTTG